MSRRFLQKNILSVGALFSKQTKREYHALKHWYKRAAIEGVLKNDQYKPAFTKHFGLTDADFAQQRMLDIGCGPRGSLEWATGASVRVGLDLCAKHYGVFGCDAHAMQYVSGGAEKIPFDNEYFDIVSSFNSIDHVEGIDMAISEIKRVTKQGGIFLLITEVYGGTNIREPHSLEWDFTRKFLPEFSIEKEMRTENNGKGLYDSVCNRTEFDSSNPHARSAFLSVMFRKL